MSELQTRGTFRVASSITRTILGITLLGCGSGESDLTPGADAGPGPGTAPVTVSFLRHDNPNYVRADKEFFAAYVAAHPNVTIVDPTVDFRTLASQLNSDLKNDTFQYDFVLIPPGRVCSYADNLTDVPEDVLPLGEAQNTFFTAPLEGSTCRGKLKALPIEYNLEYGGVVVNLDKYQAKFPGKTPGWTDWESFITEAAALAEYDAAGMPMANGLDIDPGWSPPTRHLLFAQILQRGGNYWNATRDRWVLTSKEAVDSLTAMVGWIKDRKIMSSTLIPDKNTGVPARLAAGATGWGWSDPTKPLSVMGYLGTWGVPSVAGQVPPGAAWRYDFYPLPPMVGGEHKFVTDSGWAFAVPRTSKNQAVAWDIIKSLALNPEAARKWSAITYALPALKSNGTPGAAVGNPVLARVQPLLEPGRWRGYIPAEATDMAHATIVSNYFAAARGEKTIEQALLDMQTTANAVIAQYK